MPARSLDHDTRGRLDIPGLAKLITYLPSLTQLLMYLAAMVALVWLATHVIAEIPPLPF